MVAYSPVLHVCLPLNFNMGVFLFELLDCLIYQKFVLLELFHVG